MINIAEIHWLHFSYWYIIALLCMSVLGMRFWYEYATYKTLARVTGGMQGNVLMHFSLVRRLFKYILFSLAIIFLCIGLLRPCWGKKEESVHMEGRDIVIAIDVSRSMLAHDVKPNRLVYAKDKIKKLLQFLPAERVSLIIFAGSAIIQCPLTTDYAAFQMFLDNLDAQTISSGTTALDQALLKAIDIFKQTTQRKTKLVVMFTDGEDFSSNLSAIKQDVIKNNITVFTVGVGTESGAPIPIINDRGAQEGFEKDQTGAIIMSKLNPGILKVLAQESGGQYITIAPSDADMRHIATYVNTYEKEFFDDKQTLQWNEYTFICASIALVLLLIEWII